MLTINSGRVAAWKFQQQSPEVGKTKPLVASSPETWFLTKARHPQSLAQMKLALFLTLIIAALIGWGTLSPPGPPGPPLPLNDKQIHFLAFALLTLPVTWVHLRHAIWLVPLAIFYGGAIEVIQPFFTRSAEWLDLAADAAGAITGLLPGLVRTRLRPA